MTKIKELQPRTGKVELVGQIISMEQPRAFNKFGKEGKVCNAKIKDDTGEVTLTLWNEQCDQVKVGDTVSIHNGWVSEYRGELQLSTGKFGQLEIVTPGAGKPATAAKPAPSTRTAAPPARPSTPVTPLPTTAQSSLVQKEPEFTTADEYVTDEIDDSGDVGDGADDFD
jgi:replication factor A1